ncbi:serine/threonine-protein kinase [Streptomyces sp. MAR4 CNY-716]
MDATGGHYQVFLPLTAGDPATVAGYQIKARLGEGGMGVVYLSHTRGGRPVAIKVIRPDLARDPEFRRRFRQEVKAADRVQGLYTAPVVDSNTEDEHPWLATAYVAGPSLHAAVTRHGPLPVSATSSAIAGVAEALGVIHRAEIVHRDLKPSNVLLAVDGPRVIDFGIARAADATSLTRSGAIVGTPAFMTPEQASGTASTSATDVFALGQVTVYAATGTPAFGEGSSHAVLYRIVHEEPDLGDLPTELRELATVCLEKNPAHRPTTTEIIELCRRASPGTRPPHPDQWLPAAMAADIDRHTRALTEPTIRLSPPTYAPPPPRTPTSGFAPPPPGPSPRSTRFRWILLPIVLVGLLILGNAIANDIVGDNDGDSRSDSGAGATREPDSEEPDASERPESPVSKDPENRERPDPSQYKSIDIVPGYGLQFANEPPQPEKVGAVDIEYIEYWGGNFDLATEAGTLVLLDPGQEASLDTCLADTRYTKSISRDNAIVGSRICVNSVSGHVGLVTVKEYSPSDSESTFVTVDLTVWRNVTVPSDP